MGKTPRFTPHDYLFATVMFLVPAPVRCRAFVFFFPLLRYLSTTSWGGVGGWVGAKTFVHLRCISNQVVDATSHEFL